MSTREANTTAGRSERWITFEAPPTTEGQKVAAAIYRLSESNGYAMRTLAEAIRVVGLALAVAILIHGILA